MRQKEELRREKEAARAKAANDRAIARRIAKESLELIEDERLELMELAALSKGLPSILSLDSEMLQNLESFKGRLCMFRYTSFLCFHVLSIKYRCGFLQKKRTITLLKSKENPFDIKIP